MVGLHLPEQGLVALQPLLRFEHLAVAIVLLLHGLLALLLFAHRIVARVLLALAREPRFSVLGTQGLLLLGERGGLVQGLLLQAQPFGLVLTVEV